MWPMLLLLVAAQQPVIAPVAAPPPAPAAPTAPGVTPSTATLAPFVGEWELDKTASGDAGPMMALLEVPLPLRLLPQPTTRQRISLISGGVLVQVIGSLAGDNAGQAVILDGRTELAIELMGHAAKTTARLVDGVIESRGTIAIGERRLPIISRRGVRGDTMTVDNTIGVGAEQVSLHRVFRRVKPS